MSVNMILDKIVDHNPDLLGCIVSHGGALFHNLPEDYELVDAAAVSEYASNIFTVMSDVDEDAPDFGDVFLEFEGHSMLARQMNDCVLTILSKPIKRSSLKKVQIGVNLYIKPLDRALMEAMKNPEPVPEAEPAPEPVKAEAPKEAEAQKTVLGRVKRMYRGVEY